MLVYIGRPLTHEQQKVSPSIVWMHSNFGHPQPEDFIRAQAQQDRLEPEVLTLSRRLRCATRERTKKPLPPRPTSLKSTPSFNTKLSLDFVFLHDPAGEKFNYLHVLDPAGGFSVFALVDIGIPLKCWRFSLHVGSIGPGFLRRSALTEICNSSRSTLASR